MVLNESDCNAREDSFYSPLSATGYLTPLQRKLLREKRNTPVTCPFADDFKTPKSSIKSGKKPKRPASTKPKAKPKTPKEQHVSKPAKENNSELRYSVASLVNQGTSDGTTKEKRFFKNRSPQHLQKTEFVMPLSYKKRSLDFSIEKRNTKQTLEPTKPISPNILASRENKSDNCQSKENASKTSVATTPKRKIVDHKEQTQNPQILTSKPHKSDSCMSLDKTQNPQILTSKPHKSDSCMSLDNVCPVVTTPKRKMQDRDSPEDKNNFVEQSDSVIDVTPKRKVLCRENTSVNKVEKDSTEYRMGGEIFSFDFPSDEELLKRQNEARARLKRALMVNSNNATSVKKVASAVSEAKAYDITNKGKVKCAAPKLYPIFNYTKVKKQEDKAKEPVMRKPTHCIRDTSKGEDQMIIDAGQREIGSRVCKTCNMLYAIGHEEDERLHMGYHDTYLTNLKFPGWKNECIVGDFDDGRVIKIVEKDKHFMLKKVEDVLFIANRDLGFPTAGLPSRPNLVFFLFISNDKRVGGCLVAEPIKSACPVVLGEESAKDSGESPMWQLGNWYASTKPVKAICGVNRIWVAKEFRRQKVASRLIDCLRGCFIYGHVVDCKEMAFTDPSLDGRVFAAAYTGTDNFLVYK
ncbi:hypothetical protein JTE90_004137 [Oedothorax gibbosus]|uniref:N-acetyltransferase ESCO1 n=1 Tax=Oedothorax gibbosus TaxID=931172 RepID=A0AAV6UEM6_9ARAC|nr:hypothetical protein JTE90_004137 [Oedothorax gibbosus]